MSLEGLLIFQFSSFCLRTMKLFARRLFSVGKSFDEIGRRRLRVVKAGSFVPARVEELEVNCAVLFRL